jgi:hypothetical protein
MPISAPSQDQVMGQLRAIIPALGTIASAVGVSGATANHYVDLALVMVGPIAYVVTAIWSAVAHLQSNQIANVQAIATGPAGPVAVSAQKALIEATAAVAQDKSIPASQEAANTLVSATIALPQVQGIVTDKATKEAVNNPSVVTVGPA